ncbi:MAG: outer membrane lipoprotein-sorting protein [Polyangia bacterium]
MTNTTSLALACLVLGTGTALAAPPSADELVRRYDEVMSPRTFEGVMEMIAHRQDGTTRSYTFRVLKSGNEKFRAWFVEPASAKGQEMLKVGDNMWVYMPNLKRALRIASRESFQGGDFNNGDIMRVNYVADYTARLLPDNDPALFGVELSAKSSEASYDRIRLWLDKAKRLPAKAEYYAASGKLLRSATFELRKSFHGLERPSRIVMRNELATKRFSEMTMVDMRPGVEAPAQKFVLDDLGR